MTTKVHPIVDPDQLKADVGFSENRITEAFMDQAALYVDYARQCQRAEMQADQFKLRLELIEAKIDKEIRDDPKVRVTESFINRTLASDPRWYAAKKQYNEAKAIHSMAKSALEAIKQRKDMLIQCGADLREEHKGQLRMQGATTVAERSEAAKKKLQEALQR